MKVKHLFTYDIIPGNVYNIPDVPHSVFWDLSYKCNLRCRFCYNDSELFLQSNPSKENTSKIMDILADWGVREILYLGGEPLLYPGFKSIIQHGALHSINQRIVTNGTLLNDSISSFLYEHNVEVGVSLHGIDEQTHDKMAQLSGAFNLVMSGIESLINNRVPWFLQYTLTRVNSTILSVANWLKDNYGDNARYIDINRLLPRGVGANNKDTIFPLEEEWWRSIQDIPRIYDLGISARVESIPHCWIRTLARRDGVSKIDMKRIISSVRSCYLAINQIAINPQGKFKLCPGSTDFSESIVNVSPRLIWKHHPILLERRRLEFLPSCCINYEKKTICDHFYSCGGGCKMSICGKEPRIGASDPLTCNSCNY